MAISLGEVCGSSELRSGPALGQTESSRGSACADGSLLPSSVSRANNAPGSSYPGDQTKVPTLIFLRLQNLCSICARSRLERERHESVQSLAGRVFSAAGARVARRTTAARH